MLSKKVCRAFAAVIERSLPSIRTLRRSISVGDTSSKELAKRLQLETTFSTLFFDLKRPKNELIWMRFVLLGSVK